MRTRCAIRAGFVYAVFAFEEVGLSIQKSVRIFDFMRSRAVSFNAW
jgi:hypothetical protein